jgi:integrase
VATKDQFLRVYKALPHQSAKVLARLGVSSGARLCELISFIPEDFDFAADMLAVRRSTVEVTAKYHPTGDRFLTGEYTKNGEHARRVRDGSMPVQGVQAVERGLCARPQAPPDRAVGAGVVARLAERPDRVPGRGCVAADLEHGR